MTPDRLRGWLKKIPTGTLTLELTVESDGTGLIALASWDRDEVVQLQELPADRDLAAVLTDQAQEYVESEGEKAKFLIRWMGSKAKPLKTAAHHAKPLPKDADGEPLSIAGSITDATIIRDLLKGHEAKDKQMAGAVSTLTTAYGNVIEMLSSQLKDAYNNLADERKKDPTALLAAAVPVELTDEQKEEALQRADAFKVLTEKVPDVLDLMIGIAANRFLPEVDEKKPHVSAVD